MGNDLNIGNYLLGDSHPTYFIADIGSNHNGDINRAIDLIYLAKESGANAAKFQHFLANKIVSDFGFKALKEQQSHQKNWKKSVFNTYKQYETNREWTEALVTHCKKANIDFLTTPYDFEAINNFSNHVEAFKVGSGDITWIDALKKMVLYNKPIFLATGASTMEDVTRAVEEILKANGRLVLMQCNTNYTGDIENFKYINLNVLRSYLSKWPGVILGLSDHTPGHTTVLGAISLGARVIEKHFTDDNSLSGPDHSFSMNPKTWRDMVNASRDLELALGDGVKRVENNETETVVLQRRCIRTNKKLSAGEKITIQDLTFLRPAPEKSLPPYEASKVIGKTLKVNVEEEQEILFENLE